MFNEEKRQKRLARYKKRHGFSPEETWSLDHTIAEFVLPRLKYFRKNIHTCPAEFCQGTRNSARWHKNWERTIDKMIWSFEQVVDDDAENKFFTRVSTIRTKLRNGMIIHRPNLKIDKVGYALHQKKVQEGLELFGKYFRNLWD